MTYAIEFPDFPTADLPSIPTGWQDHSWHNDACPRFHIGELAVFIDYVDPAMRDCEGAPRFSVQHIEDCVELFASDDWNAVLAFIDRRATLGARYAELVGYDPFLDDPTVSADQIETDLAELEILHAEEI